MASLGEALLASLTLPSQGSSPLNHAWLLLHLGACWLGLSWQLTRGLSSSPRCMHVAWHDCGPNCGQQVRQHSLFSACSQYHQKLRPLRELEFSNFLALSLGSEKRQLVHWKKDACICFPSSPDKRWELSILDLQGPPFPAGLARTRSKEDYPCWNCD